MADYRNLQKISVGKISCRQDDKMGAKIVKHSEIEAVIQSVQNYKEKVDEVLNEKEELKNIKPLLGGMGVYEQREKGTFMLRVRIPAGVCEVKWLRSIYEIGKEVGVRRFHLTSRQDIQYHGLTLAQTIEVKEALLKEGLVTKGGGGNSPRNIACSPLSGVDSKDIFDVTPYALASCDFIMKIIDSFHLPRKFKIAFASSKEDTSNTTVTDLGFMAMEEDGHKYFKVFVGGGLGRNPKPGIVFEEKLELQEILYVIQGLKELFEDYGDYENRNKARIRYIVERLGEEAFKAKLHDYIDKVKARGINEPIINEITYNKKGTHLSINNERLVSQKQEGLYGVYVHPFGGYLSVEELGRIVEMAEAVEDVKIRLTMDQGFYMLNLNGEEAERILAKTETLGLTDIMSKLVACTGANTCQIGLAASEELAGSIKKRFDKVPKEVQVWLPAIHISGCQSSCSAHQIAILGFCGSKKRINDEIKTVFTLSINGSKGQAGAKLGEVVGDLLMEDIPEFLEELAIGLKKGEIELEKEVLKKQFGPKII